MARWCASSSLLLVAVLSLPRVAGAQGGGADAARRALITDARAASHAGDHARAVELATRAEALRATPSLRHFLAQEHLSLGHAVEALALAGECAARVRDDATVPDREELIARCESLAQEAERGVARLTMRVPTPAPEGLRVTIGGDLLAPALYGLAVPRTPGAVEIVATATGRSPFRTNPTLVAGAREEVAVELPALPVIEPPPVPTPPPPVVPLIVPPPPTSIGAGPWILGGVGLAGLIGGGVLAAVASDARAERDAACPSATDCDPVAATGHDGRYRDLALGANLAVGVGGALVLGGVAWWVVARVTRRPAAHVSYAPSGVVVRW
jgi:hypothetical protein